MATVVRVKRRRDEDPLEILLLANKKQRNDTSGEAFSVAPDDKSIFKFAGTVSSKDDGISRQVREAIRKEKLEREYKQHQANILGTVRQETRQHKHQQSQQNRFKVISKHRALELDRLDTGADTNVEEQTVCQKCGQKTNGKCQKQTDNEQKGDKSVTEATVEDNVLSNAKENFKAKICDTSEEKEKRLTCKCDMKHNSENSSLNQQNGSVEKAGECTVGAKECDKDNVTECITDMDKAEDDRDGLFCLVDMEAENSRSRQTLGSSAAEQITCNSEPMEREVVSERPEDDDYVYDIYYTNSRQFDFRMFERDLTFEAYNGGLVFDRDVDDNNDDFVYEDEEDENAESNWRNDYPDEDPRYYENENSNYYYGDDLDEYVAFETETGNQLADWMSWRCNIDGTELSSDDEDIEHYGDGRTTYETYYKHVHKEMGEDDESVET
ncbi:probable RNA polymerase II nuclear localization protein SLC7A6OS [Mercenaria mercenaria]|uniref:probable RNA polymerase II nuclear localization protein SLC7A6OS n=1 Tax=Mercenaria mercenaria TaxID=6596 RepID=UPI001E1DADEE|nr:probable RNA polymerase II nuclear localization protein SLC7A6OS [Mercenaria mercenaria]